VGVLEPGFQRDEKMTLPTGTVTFLFTDVEGSTQRWERSRAAMEAAMRRHDALGRAAVAAHGGVVFKTMGDAFCCAFARPEDAVAAALDLQRSLVAEDFTAVGGLPVRAALHTGTADERDGDYFGPAVNRVARMLAIAHGGQVIASGVTQDVALGALPPQAAFKDLGAHRLKDLLRPEQVYQLVAPGLPSDFPALRSLSSFPNNLPMELTSFVGRDNEIDAVTDLLKRHRLVTLAGSGGVGKSRVSLQVAANLLDGSADGVWFIELAPLADGSLVASSVANALGITLPADKEPVSALVAAIRSRTMLLVFDNCEHLVEAAAAVISAILHGTPNVAILASSRQSLGVSGEMTHRMPSLEVPAPRRPGEMPLTALEARGFGAIALFADRAYAADSRFEISDENASTVAEIVRRLDGIPLAIELAAPRVKVLDVVQLGKRLDERFRILTGGGRDVLPRQQTLRALIDWSYDLLDDREQRLFARLGIFVDGFTLEAAVAVCSDERLDEFEVFDLVASLVDKSLVVAERTAQSTRYRLLESTRAYALEKLEISGDHKRVADLHLAWILALVTKAQAILDSTLREDLFESLGIEIGNVRSAIAWARASNNVDAGAVVVGCVAVRALSNFGSYVEWVAQLDYFTDALSNEPTVLLAKLYYVAAHVAGESGRSNDSLQLAEQGLKCARETGDARSVANLLVTLGVALRRARRFEEAEQSLLEAERLGGAELSPWLFAALNVSRGSLATLLGNAEEAIRFNDRVVAKYRALGVPMRQVAVFTNTAEAEHLRGETTRAIALCQEGLQAVTGSSARSNLLLNLAGYCLAVGDIAAARRSAEECIALREPIDPDSVFGTIAVEHLALAIALEGDLPRAARLLSHTTKRLAEAGFEREYTETVTYDRLRNILAEGLPPGDLTRYEAEGRDYTPRDAREAATK
jgi:predicted ATPase/class 3 adenylate cyclase